MIFNNDLYIAKVTVEEYGAENGGRRFYNLKTIKIEPADGRLEKISTSPMSDTDSTISPICMRLSRATTKILSLNRQAKS